MVLQHSGENVPLQSFERFGIAKKTSDIYQYIKEQILYFIAILLQEPHVLVQSFRFPKKHSSRDSPFDGPLFVIGKIDTTHVFQQSKNLDEIVVRRNCFALRAVIRSNHV